MWQLVERIVGVLWWDSSVLYYMPLPLSSCRAGFGGSWVAVGPTRCWKRCHGQTKPLGKSD